LVTHRALLRKQLKGKSQGKQFSLVYAQLHPSSSLARREHCLSITFGYRGVTSPGEKRFKKEIIMFTKSGVTIDNGSTEVTDVSGSRNEPAVQTNESSQQGNDDNQKWSWIYHCDEVISNMPIGLA
jgi:hypothetical protein